MDNMKETVTAGQPPAGENPETDNLGALGEEIMKLLHERTANPSEAFVMLQQMSIFLWEQYKIDWKDDPSSKITRTRKQRYLDFVSGLVDHLLANIKSE